MDTEKLITVVVWGTIVLVLYELVSKYLPGGSPATASPQLGGGTLGQVAQGLADMQVNDLTGSPLPFDPSDPLGYSTVLGDSATLPLGPY